MAWQQSVNERDKIAVDPTATSLLIMSNYDTKNAVDSYYFEINHVNFLAYNSTVMYQEMSSQ